MFKKDIDCETFTRVYTVAQMFYNVQHACRTSFNVLMVGVLMPLSVVCIPTALMAAICGIAVSSQFQFKISRRNSSVVIEFFFVAHLTKGLQYYLFLNF